MFLWPSLKDAEPAPRLQRLPRNGRVVRCYVILYGQIGELGHVKIANVKISCGDAKRDQQAVRETKAQVHPVPRVGRQAVARWHMIRWEVPLDRRPSLAAPILCGSALAIEPYRGVASLANALGIGGAMRLALRSDGCAQPTTSDR